MKTLSKITLFAVCAALSACGPQKNRIDPETQAKLIHENEMRLASLENNVHSLSSQLEQINNRTYEVRTRSGQKTSMTVVPVTASSPAAAPAAAPAAKPVPVGRKVEPKPKAAPVKKKAAAQPPQPAPAPANVAGPSGQLAPAETVALPPANLPDTTLVIPEATPPSNAPTQDSGQSVHGTVLLSTLPDRKSVV